MRLVEGGVGVGDGLATKEVARLERSAGVRADADGVDADTELGGCVGGLFGRDNAGVRFAIGKQDDDARFRLGINQTRDTRGESVADRGERLFLVDRPSLGIGLRTRNLHALQDMHKRTVVGRERCAR